jgi:CYTH domain-containing protein
MLMKYARIERERRFLLDRPPHDLPLEYRRIRDLYLDGTRLRLRRIENAAGDILDLKFGQKYSEPAGPGLSATLTNLYLTEAEYDALRTLGGRPIIKRRYAYPHQRRRFSIDVFEQQLAGLVLAEIEFDSDEAAAALPRPTFAIAEVTGEPFFTGGVLVTATAEQLDRALARWGCAARNAAKRRGS